VDLGGGGGRLDLGVGRRRPCGPEVVAYGAVQQVGLLADHADGRGEVGEREVAQVDAVEGDSAAGGVAQPRYE
jgi:hypothetical protein